MKTIIDLQPAINIETNLVIGLLPFKNPTQTWCSIKCVAVQVEMLSFCHLLARASPVIEFVQLHYRFWSRQTYKFQRSCWSNRNLLHKFRWLWQQVLTAWVMTIMQCQVLKQLYEGLQEGYPNIAPIKPPSVLHWYSKYIWFFLDINVIIL